MISLQTVQQDSAQQSLFLQQMASDESLRRELESNPVSVLARFGFEVDENQLPKNIQLPSQSELEAGMERLAANKDDQDVFRLQWQFYYELPN